MIMALHFHNHRCSGGGGGGGAEGAEGAGGGGGGGGVTFSGQAQVLHQQATRAQAKLHS